MVPEDDYNTYKEKTIKPQMIMRFSAQNVVEEILFLTHDPSLLASSYVYRVYRDNRSNLVYKNEPKTVSEHVLLLLTLEQAKGHIANLLGLKEEILLWSAYKNLEYSLSDPSQVFDPFVHARKNIIRNKSSDVIVYLYNTAGHGAIFYVITKNDLWKSHIELPLTPGVYRTAYRDFTNGIIQALANEPSPFRFQVEKTVLSKYMFQMDHKELIQILYSSFKKIVIWRSENDVDYCGDMLNIPKHLSSKKNSKYKQIDLYSKDGKEHIATCVDKVFTVYKESLFSDFVSELGWDLMKKTVGFKMKTVVKFDATVNYRLNFLINFDFFLASNGKPENIFQDQGERLTIYIAQTRITMNTDKAEYPLILEYIAQFILGYLRFTNREVIRFLKVKKVNERYITRMCQNVKNSDKRRPEKDYINVDKLLDSGYNKIGKNIYRKDGTGDIWMEDSKVGYKCVGKENIYIGFLKKQLGDDRTPACTPCCYGRSTDRSDLFKFCVHDVAFNYDMLPYISRYGRNISINRYTEIPGYLRNIISKGTIKISSDKNRKIHSAKDYPVIYRMDREVYLPDFKSRLEFLASGDIVIIEMNKFNVHPNTVQRYMQRESNFDPKIYIIVQNKLYYIKLLTKELVNKPDTKVSNLKKEHIQAIFTHLEWLSFNMKISKSNNITWNGTETKVDNRVYNNNLSTMYFIRNTIQVIEPNMLSWYIKNMLSNYFDTILTEDKEEFENQFVFNIMKFSSLKNPIILNPRVAYGLIEEEFDKAEISYLLNPAPEQ